MSTLAQFQSVASELAAMLPSDVPLTAVFEPIPPAQLSLAEPLHEVIVHRVGGQEINFLLVVSQSVIAPLLDSGLDLDANATLTGIVEQVAPPLGEAITVASTLSQEQFLDGSGVVFILQAGAQTRGWFVIQIREVSSMSNDSFTPSAQSEELAAAVPPVSPELAASAAAPVQEAAPVSFSAPVSSPAYAASPSVGSMGNMRLLYDVEMTLTAEIGRAKLPVRQILDLTPGAIVELDRVAGSPADLMVNGHLVARGEVVVIDEDYGLRITEILDTSEAFA